MKAKKILALVLALCMVVSLFPMAYAAEEEVDALSFADATATELTPKLDGEDIKVTMYEDLYLANTTIDDQKVAVYVPENATADSPIVLYVNNSGWQSNSYSGRNGVSSYGWVEETKRGETVTVLKGDYVSDSDSDAIGKMLAEGYVIVGYGCRSRNNGASEDGTYNGHSPATMSDTKAVIRYLRYNADLLPAGDPEKIVVTGTSGGGALSVVIAGSGDSADYYPSLYASGAAGIVKNEDGTYSSTISDAVWATVAYCPITDLGNACAAYEWTWGETRFAQIEAGDIEYTVPTDAMKEASALLTANFEEYVDSLGIGVTADTMEETIIALMKTEIEESIEEIGAEQMKADLGDTTWLVINEDGTYTYDYEAHKYAVGLKSKFKAASAFSNTGMSTWKGNMNEDNLFGTTADAYAPFNEYSWNNDDTENAVGKDSTGKTWDEYMATPEGEALALQMKMTSPIQYLLDAEGESTSAPNWYVRYGMYDRDSSWAIETVLLKSLEADKSIEDINFEFAWLKGHAGNYDVQEAWAWVKEQLAEDAAKNTSFADAVATELSPKLDGEDIKVTMYEDLYLTNTTHDDQKVAVYVSENATEDSPIVLYVNNGGWQGNSYSGRKGVKSYGTEEGRNGPQTVGDYKSTGNDEVGRMLADGYVIVAYGCRSRNNGQSADGTYNGHSPATMSDTKAVIRYLRANADLLPAGDPEKIIVTGTSGGGALSTVLAASGNSPDYFPALYEAGAAGIDYVDGEYVNTISDAVWGVVAYCPITDLGHACAAYEWQYNATREAMYESGHMDYGNVTKELNMAASAELKAVYEKYLDTLGVEEVKAENLEASIITLMEAEIAESIEEIGVEQMKADLAATDYAGTWITFNEDGTFEYDYDEHLYWLARKQTLKAASAFSNTGMSTWKGNMNEDNLFGSTADAYSPFNPYSWANDDTENAVGQDDTGKTWEEFLATEAGARLQLQTRMTSAVDYLYDAEDGDTAPYWYVRHGMADRDTAFAVETTLYYGMVNDPAIEDYSFEFAWLKGHAGNYDVEEAWAWVADALKADAAKNTDLSDATVTELVPTVDGKPVKVTWYADGYLNAPNSEKQLINVYVPENATADSPIMFYVNNSGWMSNNYPTNTIEDGKDYNGTTDRVGVALKEGYVVVSYGCRSRTDAVIGHSPATMTDTKAAIRFLRANADIFGAGDTDKIVITGTSGGGALSVIIAASGNSADYYPSLYEVGAAGIDYVDGKYVSTINDDVWATIAYCPITDLGNACAAYDWTWGEARAKLMADGSLSYKGATAEQVNKNAEALTAIYEEYLDTLGLEAVSAANLEATIIAMMEKEITESIQEVGIEQMKADLGEATWLTFNEDGSFTYDYDAHVLWVAQQTALKISPAFSNVGTGYKEFMNEDNLFGAPEDVYSPFNEYSWSIDATENNVGLDDTGKTWDEYMATPDGERLALQIKMTNPIPYLLDAEDGDSAEYWYVRYGMADRDSSFAVEAVLNAAMEADKSIKGQSFEFAWLKPHSGNYDVPEAYAWLKLALEAETAVASNQALTVDGEAVETEVYNVAGNNYFKLRDIAAMLVGTDAEFAVEFDTATRTVYIDTDGKYEAVGGELETGADKSATTVVTEWIVYVDGVLVPISGYNIGGNNFFKLRELADAIGFGVDYDAATRTMIIKSAK